VLVRDRIECTAGQRDEALARPRSVMEKTRAVLSWCDGGDSPAKALQRGLCCTCRRETIERTATARPGHLLTCSEANRGERGESVRLPVDRLRESDTDAQRREVMRLTTTSRLAEDAQRVEADRDEARDGRHRAVSGPMRRSAATRAPDRADSAGRADMAVRVGRAVRAGRANFTGPSYPASSDSAVGVQLPEGSSQKLVALRTGGRR